MSFISGLKKFGMEALKIGQYVAFGAQAAQAVQVQLAPQSSTGTDFLSRFIDIVKSVEVTGQAAATIGSATSTNGTPLSGPQKLAAATALIANELSALHIGGKAITQADSFAKAAQGFAQATVDYLQAFDQGVVAVAKNGPTTAIPAAPASAPPAVVGQ